MSFRPNYAKKPEGEEKKSKAYSFRRQHFRRNDVTDEEKAIMAMEGVENMENAEGIIRYSIEDMLKLRQANTAKPEMADEACVIGYERLSEMLKEQADLIAEKEACYGVPDGGSEHSACRHACARSPQHHEPVHSG